MSEQSAVLPSRPVARPLWSLHGTVIFWWILFLVIQQTERLFLLPETLQLETPTASGLVRTLVTGFQGDLIIATICLLLAGITAFPVGWLLSARSRQPERQTGAGLRYKKALAVSSSLLAGILVLLLTVDMGYYRYDGHHLDFVFLEYLDDLITQASDSGVGGSQAAQQTNAEMQNTQKWGMRLLSFWLVESAVIAAWWFCFIGIVGPGLARWIARFPRVTTAGLLFGLMVALAGFNNQGPYAIRTTPISSATYYTLAQNPVLYASESLRAALRSRLKETQPQMFAAMPLTEAVQKTQEILGHGAQFPYSRYPLVRVIQEDQGLRFRRRANVLLIFVEGLDRRFINRTVHGVQLTPFLDRLKDESLYFDRFFANGTQTARGLFASFCSYYPRQGTAEMKTRYTRDYLCLPSMLRKGGYRTEMVIGEDRDLNRLHLFMARNGLHQLLDKTDFPSADRTAYGPSSGRPDGALFDVMRKRIEASRDTTNPWFLTALTTSMHHPFAVPQTHPDIRLLAADSDGYLAALRYLDLEFERFFTQLRRDGLLKDTLLVILGDHGRHEPIGRTDIERQVGHFTTPLFIWIDESLREGVSRYPRTVSVVASQVDLAPTILALNGLMPTLAPFVGRDLSCLLVADCLDDNVAFLSSAHDDSIGLADRRGLSFYSLRRDIFYHVAFDLTQPLDELPVTDPHSSPRYRDLMAMYVSSNMLLEQNRIWSWKDLGGKL